MSSTNTHKIMEKIDEIKEKLSNNEYLDLCNLLKKKSENDYLDKLYRVRYFSQQLKLVVDTDSDNSLLNQIVCSTKTIVCKFDNDVEDADRNGFILDVNRSCQSLWSVHFKENIEDGITRLDLIRYDDIQYADITSLINNDDVEHDLDVINCCLRFKKNIIYSIEEV